MIKNKLPHTTLYSNLIELKVLNGDKILEEHINQNPANAQYTSKLSTNMLLEALDTYIHVARTETIFEFEIKSLFFPLWQMNAKIFLHRRNCPSVAGGWLMAAHKNVSCRFST